MCLCGDYGLYAPHGVGCSDKQVNTRPSDCSVTFKFRVANLSIFVKVSFEIMIKHLLRLTLTILE